jgi:hypothetical protein
VLRSTVSILIGKSNFTVSILIGTSPSSANP